MFKLKIQKFVNIPVFLISLFIGMVAVYVAQKNEIRKVFVYPTPDNIGTIQYQDHANNCYEFRQTLQECPTDILKLSKIIPS